MQFQTAARHRPLTTRLMLITLTFLAACLGGCAGVPGKTGAEQVETVDALVERTLADLYAKDPATKEAIATSVGYVVMNNKITKVPVVGAGTGYGVAIDNKTGARTYLRMARVDLGGGWGARGVRPVLIFTNPKVFQSFINGEWEAQVGLEASAKVGETGAAGGAGSGDVGDKGYVVHMITDAGVSATATVGLIRVKPVDIKK